MAKKVRATVFDELRESLQDALAFEKGHEVNLRVTELPPRPRKLHPKDIRAIRLSLNASQVIFATFLNVSANTVRSWEQGTRRPQGADLKLLAIAKKNPQALLRS
jgi:putative transcriptional regulator